MFDQPVLWPNLFGVGKNSYKNILVIIRKNDFQSFIDCQKLLLWKEKSSTTSKIIDWTYVMCDPVAWKRISFNQQNRSLT